MVHWTWLIKNYQDDVYPLDEREESGLLDED